MSSGSGNPADSFGGISPRTYHRWRLESELYGRIESPVLLPLLQAVPYRRALDIGCGTGLWTCVLQRLRPEAECIGIDIADEMIAFAATQCPARFVTVDALRFRDVRRFDLIISALSADYIGLPDFFAAVAANLAASGVAYAWVLDPRRYPCSEGLRVKTWDVSGRLVRVEIADYDVTGISRMAAEKGLCCTVTATPFRLSDGMPRSLLCVRCTP